MPGVKLIPRSTVRFAAARTVVKRSLPGSAVARTASVVTTSWFGSAPWSPLPLTVDVIAQMLTVPSRLTRPVMFRSPSVAGAQGRAVTGLSPVG